MSILQWKCHNQDKDIVNWKFNYTTEKKENDRIKFQPITHADIQTSAISSPSSELNRETAAK